MTDGVPVLVCTRCDRVVFPERLLCPTCGRAEWRRESIATGVVEETTILRRAGGELPAPVPIGSVRLDGGPAVVARLPANVAAGTRVLLAYETGVPVVLHD